MASLKEVKTRITSVTSTKKITSAMKMVSSAKLKKAQYTIENIAPYQKRLNKILNNFLATETDFSSDYAAVRPLKRVAIVVFSSNTSLCGAFNSNVIKRLKEVVEEYKELGEQNVVVYPIGRKVSEAVKRLQLTLGGTLDGERHVLADKPNFDAMTQVTNTVMDKFLNKEFDKVIVIYHHLKSTAVQKLFTETFLPLQLSGQEDKVNQVNQGDKAQKEDKVAVAGDYIVEPGKQEVLQVLLPKALRMKLYSCLLDSHASEHGARTVAMQIATDNADGLIKELSVLYNKTRQQTITSELLDIVSGVAALQGSH
ncbi:ATP synthase gamma chain [Bacteroidia bacterium]|nr:ATP synthase gamma chain [Bacteroidia bacterium]